MSSVGLELPKEIVRVRDVLIPQYQSIGPVGVRQELVDGVRTFFEAEKACKAHSKGKRG